VTRPKNTVWWDATRPQSADHDRRRQDARAWETVRALRPLAVGLVVGALAFACDRSPTAVPTLSLLVQSSTSKYSALVPCSQSYDSVTGVIGPAGGSLVVGRHTLYVDALALTNTVSITAVAPAGPVRWVRFQPDGLVFQTNPKDGWGAVLYTSYKDCGVLTSVTPRIAQVTDSLTVLGYLATSVKIKNNPWSQGQQFVAAVLPHFSNYAVAW